ncbi:MAG TPA: anthranilate synthase component I [Blastocatellia bacterium]|nr:anthranilate synthase component I [Blastocatellia bacterium]HMZ21318.1 anthranilate synthase component I [Blastocatellia bacterium]HNG30720.1 anthranilate synthase component I [Blastocatellia bacterium]
MSSITPSTYEEFLSLAAEGTVVPLVKTVMADLLTPVSAYLRIERQSPRAFLFESIEGGEKIARYSFLGCAPHTIVRARGNQVTVERADGSRETLERPMLNVLRDLMREHQPVKLPGLPPFSCGAVGYFGYDAVRWFERLPAEAKDDLNIDTAVVMFFAGILAFDHVKHQIHIIANVFTDGERDGTVLRDKYIAACGEIARLEASLAAPIEPPPSARRTEPLQIRSNMTKESYVAAIEAIKEYIKAGDAFQVVFAQRFETDITVHPFQIYRALRVVNPSPYMFFLKLGGEETVLGASPEMLIKCEGRQLEYRPIAGTYPRGKSEAEDAQFANALLHDEKERAEHVMLVDLGRNDLGRVAKYGSVKVADLMFVERFSHVMHLVSSLKAVLREGLDCFDAFAATFPAGTVSGAPKVRAMEIIDELEPTRRGAYAGSVLYFDYSGNLDSCIALRTMYARGNRAYIQAGGGIVADSVPETEFQETVNKSRALVRAIEMAEKEL